MYYTEHNFIVQKTTVLHGTQLYYAEHNCIARNTTVLHGSQLYCTESMRIFCSPYSAVLSVIIPTDVKKYFICEEKSVNISFNLFLQTELH